jgi:pimeloyl-ACP methyl ester carboxylesterase
MVLLHGFTNDWQAWTAVLPALEERFDVFAPTLPGHFGGEALEAGVPVSMDAMAEMLERQLDAQGIERAHLVGNSLGAWLSLELALRGRALSVTCLCPAGGWEPRSAEERATYRFFWRMSRIGLPLSRPFFRSLAARPRLRALALRDVVSRPDRIGPTLALAGLEAASGCAIAAELLAASKGGELFGELGPIECPVTIATATEDRLFPAPPYFVKFRRLLPEASWVELEGLGHIPMTDDPARVTEVILGTALPEAIPLPRPVPNGEIVVPVEAALDLAPEKGERRA